MTASELSAGPWTAPHAVLRPCIPAGHHHELSRQPVNVADVPCLQAGQEATQETVTIADMGMHMLRALPGLHLVVQVLVPGLEERARILPPLTSSFSTPGAAWGWAVTQGGPGCVLHLHISVMLSSLGCTPACHALLHSSGAAGSFQSLPSLPPCGVDVAWLCPCTPAPGSPVRSQAQQPCRGVPEGCMLSSSM